MSKNWKYVSRGHYSKSDGNGGTIHVAGKSVYVTHPSRATKDITGSDADKYIASATGMPMGKTAKKPAANGKKTTKKTTKKNGVRKAKSFAKAAGRVAKAAAAPAVSVGRAVASAGAVAIADETRTADRRRPLTIEQVVFGIAPPKAKKAKAKKPKKAKKAKKAETVAREAVIIDGKVYYRAAKAKKKRKPKKKTPAAPKPQTIEQYLGF